MERKLVFFDGEFKVIERYEETVGRTFTFVTYPGLSEPVVSVINERDAKSLVRFLSTNLEI